jgi:carbamate kinase
MDPAFGKPSKPIGPVYSQAEAAQASAEHGWTMVRRQAVACAVLLLLPRPFGSLVWMQSKLLLAAGHTVICAGGGGIPVMRNADAEMEGVEAVIDKDRTSAHLALGLNADALLLLTDVAAVFEDYGGPDQRAITSDHATGTRAAGSATWPDRWAPRSKQQLRL